MTIASGTAGYYITGFMLKGAAPTVFPNGTAETATALTDRYVSNSNFTVWYFHVRPGEKWSNGQAINASDILATFGPKFGFNPIYDFPGTGAEVASERAVNASMAMFVLNKPDAHFPDRLRVQYFSHVYPAQFVKAGGENQTYFVNPLSAGPFVLSNYTEGSFQMTLSRNPYFSPQLPMSQVQVTFVDSLALTATPLLSGSTDLAPVEPSNAASILSNPNLGIVDEKGYGSATLDYNISIYPYNMTSFRQALVYGINQSSYIHQAFGGYALTAYNAEGVISPIATNYYNPNIQKYNYDPSKALSLLSSIGITKGSDYRLHYRNGTVATLTIWAATDNSADVIGAQAIKASLQSLGFNVNLQTASASNLISYYGSNTQDIRASMILYSNFIQIWGLPFEDILPGWDVYYLPTIPEPYWEYPPSVNAEYQSNATAFANTNDPNTIKHILANVQAINAQNLPTIVLAYPDALWGYSKVVWTNWPTNYIDLGAEQLSWTSFEQLIPVASVATSTTQSTATSSSLTSGQGAGAGLQLSYVIGGGVVVAAVLVAIAYIGVRRRSARATP
jgi:peptide/nickel transport system substrate-binding protein